MKRTVFRLGKSTLVVSLPAKWTKKYGLKPGDELLLVEHDKNINLSTDKEYAINEISIDITGLNQDIVNEYLSSAYIRGFERIKLVFKNQESIAFVQEALNHAIGMAVIEQGNSYCVVGEITTPTYDQFENILRRIFILTISEADDSLIALENADKEALKGVAKRDIDIDKFIHFCLRILNKRGHEDFSKTPSIYALLHKLGELGNNYRRLTYDLTKNDISSIRKEIKQVYKETNMAIRKFYELYYSLKKESILDFHEQYLERSEKIKSMNTIKNLKQEELLIMYHLRKFNETLYELFRMKIIENF